MKELAQLWSGKVTYPADTIEWCPSPTYRDLFVCGTYFLDEQTRKRCGTLELYEFTLPEPKKLQCFDTDAITDCKWFYCQSKYYLVTVTTVGTVMIYALDDKELKEVTKISLTAENVLLLSVDWFNHLSDKSSALIAISDSKGTIHLLKFSDSVEKLQTFDSHSLEAWIVGFNYFKEKILYSGGDDGKLIIVDQSTNTRIKKLNHSAGVTSIQHSFKDENLFATGSYDENIFLWDLRSMKTPLKTLDVGGGVWRLKWEPTECEYLAAPCMYGGSKVINTETFQCQTSYNFHESINYGIDWQRIEPDSKTQAHTLAICSFYDKVLSVAQLVID